MTFESYFGDLLTVVFLSAQLTRELLAIAKFLVEIYVLTGFLARLKGQRLPTLVHRPSRGYISKTKQDRPLVTMEH